MYIRISTLRAARRLAVLVVLGSLLACSNTNDEAGDGDAEAPSGGDSETDAADQSTPANGPATQHGIDLSGDWVSSDYQCPGGVRNREVVRLEHDERRLVGTKVVGDDCVPAGRVSFEGDLPNDTLRPADLPISFPAKVYGGEEGRPDTIRSSSATGRVVSADEIELVFPVEGSIRLRRVQVSDGADDASVSGLDAGAGVADAAQPAPDGTRIKPSETEDMCRFQLQYWPDRGAHFVQRFVGRAPPPSGPNATSCRTSECAVTAFYSGSVKVTLEHYDPDAQTFEISVAPSLGYDFDPPTPGVINACPGAAPAEVPGFRVTLARNPARPCAFQATNVTVGRLRVNAVLDVGTALSTAAGASTPRAKLVFGNARVDVALLDCTGGAYVFDSNLAMSAGTLTEKTSPTPPVEFCGNWARRRVEPYDLCQGTSP